MVTHSSTSRPVQCLCMAERTGCPVFTDLWSYVPLSFVRSNRYDNWVRLHARWLQFKHQRMDRLAHATPTRRSDPLGGAACLKTQALHAPRRARNHLAIDVPSVAFRRAIAEDDGGRWLVAKPSQRLEKARKRALGLALRAREYISKA